MPCSKSMYTYNCQKLPQTLKFLNKKKNAILAITSWFRRLRVHANPEYVVVSILLNGKLGETSNLFNKNWTLKRQTLQLLNNLPRFAES